MGTIEPPGDGVVLLLTTTGSDEEAHRLGRALVEARLAGCVSLIHPIWSTYRWAGSVVEEKEWLLLVKTTSAAEEAAREMILREHPYDIPELLTIVPAAVSERYLRWLQEATLPEEDR